MAFIVFSVVAKSYVQECSTFADILMEAFAALKWMNKTMTFTSQLMKDLKCLTCDETSKEIFTGNLFTIKTLWEGVIRVTVDLCSVFLATLLFINLVLPVSSRRFLFLL